MKPPHLQIFKDLPAHEFFKTSKKAVRTFKILGDYPDALGYDEETGGFLALQIEESNLTYRTEGGVWLTEKRTFQGMSKICFNTNGLGSGGNRALAI